MLVGTDVCVPVVFVWEETGVPRGNPPVWLDDHMTIAHADAGYWTQVAAVRGEHVTTMPARQLKIIGFISYEISQCIQMCKNVLMQWFSLESFLWTYNTYWYFRKRELCFNKIQLHTK